MVGEQTGSWVLAVAAGFVTAGGGRICVAGGRVPPDARAGPADRRLVTIGLSIVLADVMLWIWGGEIYTFEPPRWIYGSTDAAAGREVPDLSASLCS
mgnify:CR=1 FL=1